MDLIVSIIFQLLFCVISHGNNHLTKILGKWKSMTYGDVETLTNERSVETYEAGGKGFISSCNAHPVTKELGWINKKPFTYTITDSYVTVKDNRPEGGPEGGTEGGPERGGLRAVRVKGQRGANLCPKQLLKTRSRYCLSTTIVC